MAGNLQKNKYNRLSTVKHGINVLSTRAVRDSTNELSEFHMENTGHRYALCMVPSKIG